MSKKIIIIGAGIAGLASGCYGQLNDYETEIHEMHNLPGGLCTAWKRKGYTFDGCIHWLMGTRPETSFYKYWNEIGALDGLKFHQHDYHLQLEDGKGRKFVLGSDMDSMEKQLLELSPQDEPSIRELIGAIKTLRNMSMPMDKPQDMYSFWDYLKMMIQMGPKAKEFMKLNKISIGQFAERFTDPFLKEALPGVMCRDYTMLVYAMVLATYVNKDTAWPMGGSLEFARNIEKSYLKLGGKIHYHSKVERILVKDNRAIGIRLADGTERFADFIISAADGYTTIFKMLEGKYIDKNILSLYQDTPVAPTSVQVSLGVNCDLSDEPCSLAVKLDNPIKVGNIENNYATFRHYGYDATMAPPGKSAVTSLFYSDYEHWEKLYADKTAYEAEKEKIAEAYIKAFEKRFPQAKGKIEVIDVLTPYTYTRYTGTWKGSYMSWIATPEKPMLKVPGRLPGLGSFYLAGQWANSSGGVPVGVITGRWALQRICKDDKRKFRTA